MAEYYAVLKKAVAGVEAGSTEARRAVYDKARNALIGQLKAIDPPLAASEISRQRLELEEAIRRVERETAAEMQGARPSPPPNRPAVEPPAPGPVPERGAERVPPTPGEAEAQPSPQDVFRRAIQEAEMRGATAQPTVERAPPRETAPQTYADRVTDVQPAGDWRRGRPTYQDEPPRRQAPPEPEAQLAPDYDDDWRPPRDGARNMPPEPYAERREPPPERREPRRSKRPRDEYFEEDDVQQEPERRARRSRLPAILLIVLIVGMIGGLGALAWSQRSVIADLVAGFDGQPAGETTPTPPEMADASPQQAEKSSDRLIEGEADDSSVRVVGESAAPVPAADSIADTINSAPQASGDALVAQKAVLYEEPLDAAAALAGVTAIDAVVTWRFVENGTSGPEILADIEVPERGMNVRLTIRRNTDATLPSSHLVEMVIDTPSEFPGKGIARVPRLVLKPQEDERGEPLIGAAAKVADGFFWIALSAAEGDVDANIELLRTEPWIDLPMVYDTGQRAILTFEKGTPGERVFEQAFAAWSTG